MAVEKYLLEELTPELRDEFEEHFFDCQECALDVQATAAFMAAARQEFKANPVPKREGPSKVNRSLRRSGLRQSSGLRSPRRFSWSPIKTVGLSAPANRSCRAEDSRGIARHFPGRRQQSRRKKSPQPPWQPSILSS